MRGFWTLAFGLLLGLSPSLGAWLFLFVNKGLYILTLSLQKFERKKYEKVYAMYIYHPLLHVHTRCKYTLYNHFSISGIYYLFPLLWVGFWFSAGKWWDFLGGTLWDILEGRWEKFPFFPIPG